MRENETYVKCACVTNYSTLQVSKVMSPPDKLALWSILRVYK